MQAEWDADHDGIACFTRVILSRCWEVQMRIIYLKSLSKSFMIVTAAPEFDGAKWLADFALLRAFFSFESEVSAKRSVFTYSV